MLFLRSQIAQKRRKLLVSEDEYEYEYRSAGHRFRKILLLLVLSVVWILFTGCECECDVVEKVTPVCFEYHYINHAWGTQEHGWLMDRHGNIWSFNMPADYLDGAAGGYLTLEEMEHNLALTDSVIGTVEPAELDSYLALIPGAAEGQIGEARQIAADAGSSTLSCYLYDMEKHAYRYVFLGMSGDWEQFNLSEEADSLVSWLKGFGVFWISDW